MPVNDWSRAEHGFWHDFHQMWTLNIRHELNRHVLPDTHYALVEQYAGGRNPDVLSLELRSPDNGLASDPGEGGLAVQPLPRTKYRFSGGSYVRRQNRIRVRHRSDDRVVAAIELISPGSKSSQNRFDAMLRKIGEYLESDVHLLLVDLLPPTPRDPQGIHGSIWDSRSDEPFELPPETPLTLASYRVTDPLEAFVELVGVGDPLPPMPLFLDVNRHVTVPLDTTYEAAFGDIPKPLRQRMGWD